MAYSRLPAFVLGFHGCDRAVAERILASRRHLTPSRNDYDWLGHGIYFWENDPVRARQWASEKGRRARNKGKPFTPAVVGAVIDLGNCLNLTDARSNALLRIGYDFLEKTRSGFGQPMPVNRDLPGSTDLLFRHLDCAVINAVHELIAAEESDPFDSVRAPFIEGPPAYPGAALRAKNHIQICVRRSTNIRGYFRVLPERAS